MAVASGVPAITPAISEQQAKRMSRARTRLLLDYPFFGTLSLNLIMVEDNTQPTCATDGTELKWNAGFIAGCSDDEVTFCIAHETMHCAMGHVWRMAGREAMPWNVACDYAINPILIAAGMKIPADCLDDAQYHNMYAEQIYAKMPKQPEDMPQPGGKRGPGTGSPDMSPGQAPAKPGDKPGPTTPQPGGMTEIDWQIATEQAAVAARKAGTMPGDAERAINASREAKVDWREVLRRFIERTIPSDYSWATPNKRYIAGGPGYPGGLYLPGVVKENAPRIVVAIDTSGSVSDDLLNQFAAELSDIMYEVRPSSVDVVYCDTRVNNVQTFTPDEGPVTLEAKGRGGTAFQPVFTWLAEQDEQPACLIYATDLDSSDTPVEPEIPVLWLAPEWASRNGPFGETVRFSHTDRW